MPTASQAFQQSHSLQMCPAQRWPAEGQAGTKMHMLNPLSLSRLCHPRARGVFIMFYHTGLEAHWLIYYFWSLGHQMHFTTRNSTSQSHCVFPIQCCFSTERESTDWITIFFNSKETSVRNRMICPFISKICIHLCYTRQTSADSTETKGGWSL